MKKQSIGKAVAELFESFTIGVDYASPNGKAFLEQVSAEVGKLVPGGAEAVKACKVGAKSSQFGLHGVKLLPAQATLRVSAFIAAKQAEGLYEFSGIHIPADVSEVFAKCAVRVNQDGNAVSA